MSKEVLSGLVEREWLALLAIVAAQSLQKVRIPAVVFQDARTTPALEALSLVQRLRPVVKLHAEHFGKARTSLADAQLVPRGRPNYSQYYCATVGHARKCVVPQYGQPLSLCHSAGT